MDKQTQDSLESEIRQYFASHIHSGWHVPLELYFLRERSETFYHPVPKGIDDEELDDNDIEFDKGLAEIGAKFGIRLELEIRFYRK